MKIYAITFLAVAGLTFGFATTPLDTLYWLLFTLELPSAVMSILPVIILYVAVQLALYFPATAIIVVALVAGYANNRAGQ